MPKTETELQEREQRLDTLTLDSFIGNRRAADLVPRAIEK